MDEKNVKVLQMLAKVDEEMALTVGCDYRKWGKLCPLPYSSPMGRTTPNKVIWRLAGPIRFRKILISTEWSIFCRGDRLKPRPGNSSGAADACSRAHTGAAR